MGGQQGRRGGGRARARVLTTSRSGHRDVSVAHTRSTRLRALTISVARTCSLPAFTSDGKRVKTLSTFVGIIDRHTITVTVLAVAATHFAIVYDFAADIPTTLIGIAVIFPIVFSIQAAWERRE